METTFANPLIAIALIFAAGFSGGLVAKYVKLPSVTGNILAGVLLGPSALGFFSYSTAQNLESVTIFAMGLMTVVIGGHLNYRRLHNAKRRILSVTFFEVTLTSLFVGTASYMISGGNLQVALILGAIATATAPATVLSVFREERAKGLMVKTALASVALDNVLCVVIFTLVAATVTSGTITADQGIWLPLLNAVFKLFLSASVGYLAAKVLLLAVRAKVIPPFSGLLFAVLATSGGSELAGISPLLTNLVMGVALGNSGRDSEEVLGSLDNLEPVVLTCFFTLAGVNLHLSSLPAMGFLGAGYFVARALGKVGGGLIGSYVGAATAKTRLGTGATLLPQAGLAIGLVVIMQGDPRFPPELVEIITNVVLAAVILNEVLGPPIVRRAVRHAGEAGKDRRRLVEFLQEEYILYPLKAEDRWEAIRQLGEFLIRTHGLRDVSLDELVESVVAREKTFSTAIGSGVALPHARLDAGPEIVGVMGISPGGIDFDAPDDESVRVVILIATPEGHENQHLEVMAAVAGLMSDQEIRAHLLTARSAAEAYEIIETSSKKDYNHFLED